MNLVQPKLSQRVNDVPMNRHKTFCPCGNTDRTTQARRGYIDTVRVQGQRTGTGGVWGGDQYPLSVQPETEIICRYTRRRVLIRNRV